MRQCGAISNRHSHMPYSQPVAGGEAPVNVESALVGNRPPVAIEHGPIAPPGDAHQVAFGAAIREPPMSERVAEHVGV